MHKFLLLLLCTNYVVGGIGQENAIKSILLKKIESNQNSLKKDLVNLKKEIQDVNEGLGYLLPTDCSEVKRRWSKVAKIKPPGLSMKDVLCDHQTNGGRWTVVVSRNAVHKLERETTPALNENNQDSFVDFNRTWEDYRLGFGNPRTEYWIGNDVMHALTKEGHWEAMVVLEDWNGDKGQASWGKFKVFDGKKDKYKLEISQFRTKESTIGRRDGFSIHRGKPFSTFDVNSGITLANGRSCAEVNGGGWWYNHCHVSYLTGTHLKKGQEGINSVQWREWTKKKSLKKALLMIRPYNLLK